MNLGCGVGGGGVLLIMGELGYLGCLRPGFFGVIQRAKGGVEGGIAIHGDRGGIRTDSWREGYDAGGWMHGRG